MKNAWVNILLYGLSLGLLLVALELIRYKWVLIRNTGEWYGGILALFFTILGIWAGTRYAGRNKPSITPAEQPPAPPEEIINRLGLTPRELEVLDLMAQGHSNQEIADRLYVSLNTVKTHISNLLSKLDAERRTQAIQRAKTLGLLS